MENAKKTFSKIGIIYLIISILTIVAGVIISTAVSIVSPKALSSMSFSTLLTTITQFIIPLAIGYVLLKQIKTTPIKKHKLSLKKFLICVCITLALIYIGDYIIGAGIKGVVGVFKPDKAVDTVTNLISGKSIWLRLLESCLLAPIVEELLYRKLLIDRTIKFGAGISIFISALIFGFCHGNLTQTISAFIGGCFFAFVYIKTGNIIYTIILHMIANFFCLVVDQILAFGNLTMEITLFGVMIILIAMTAHYIYLWRDKIKVLKENVSKLIKKSLLNVGMISQIIYTSIFIIAVLIH